MQEPLREESADQVLETDAIVVGLGAVGSAVTLQLARRGLGVIGLDRFRPPHVHGSTHGETRITRIALGEGPSYVPLVRRSHELWRAIERETGTALLHRTGGLVIAPPGDPFLGRTREVAADFEIEHENLSNAELRRRFPMFGVDTETEAYFEPEAGFVRPEAAVAAQLGLAERAGATVRAGETVVSWTASSTGVQVITGSARIEARELVLCAGAWIAELFPDSGDLFAVYPQVMHWFPIRSGYEALREMPVFVWETGGERDEFAHGTGFYGFPAIDGADAGVKLATETYATRIVAEELPLVATADAAARFYEQHLAQRFPWVGAEPLRSVPCLYTSTRGSRFVIDRHPSYSNVTIVSACSGHGFKHSAAVGEAVSQVLVDGRSAIDLAPFALGAG